MLPRGAVHLRSHQTARGFYMRETLWSVAHQLSPDTADDFSTLPNLDAIGLTAHVRA